MGGIASPAAGAFASGLRYTLSATDKLFSAIRASASQSRLKVISSPHILASNNKEARIQIGTSQPILSNTYTTTATGTPGVVEGSIEYKDTGIILTVTPRISDGGLVSLDINVESSTVATTSLGNLSSIPVFNKKMAKTTLAILEGQTIVIGGLIEETKDQTSSGVPFLSKIPILGALFGYQSYEKKRTETLLLMTPHVITDLDQSIAITREFREKVGGIKKEVEMRDKMEKKE
jgi:general secretion pathway protein D